MTTDQHPWQETNLCGKHAGQIVTPVVEWRFHGPDKVALRWHWSDASDRTTSGHGEWTGPKGEADKRLRQEGIFVDDSRAPF